MNENNNNFEQSFLGTGWSFPPTFNRQVGEVKMVSNEEDIQQSLEIIITTSMKERVMRPQFGSRISEFVFEPLDASLKTYLKDIIETAIIYFEPRVEVESIRLKDTAEVLEGMLIIEIDYLIRGTNTRYNLVFPYYLSEATDIINR